MKRTYFLPLIIGLILLSVDIMAQTSSLSAELRPRFEFRNGYKQLMPDGNNPAAFISQRTRLNGFYSNEKFKFKISLQDVRVWGDVNQLNTSDINGTSVHEAWGEILFSKVVSFKVGRQEIIYDDHRIFGSVGWAQQARSHDAAILKFKANSNHDLHLGIAYNAVKESLYKLDYIGMANYKAMQFIHYHGKFNKLGVSILELYNGIAYDSDTSANVVEKIAWSLTIGPRLSYTADKFSANIAFYYQGGKNGANTDLTATYFAADVNFKIIKNFSFGIGGEYLSGTNTKDKGTDNSFTPFYGTNHKFNGWMDYFYVGNHGGNVGLTDFYLPLNYNLNNWSFALITHNFMSAATVSEKQTDGSWKDFSNTLGTEIDLSITYKLNKAVKLQAGYSQMFATQTMQVLKGGNYNNSNNWAWVMITFKPTFFEK